MPLVIIRFWFSYLVIQWSALHPNPECKTKSPVHFNEIWFSLLTHHTHPNIVHFPQLGIPWVRCQSPPSHPLQLHLVPLLLEPLLPPEPSLQLQHCPVRSAAAVRCRAQSWPRARWVARAPWQRAPGSGTTGRRRRRGHWNGGLVFLCFLAVDGNMEAWSAKSEKWSNLNQNQYRSHLLGVSL